MVRHPSPTVLLNKGLQDLLNNPETGDKIKKNIIPKFYFEHYEVNNLYRYDHPEGFRSCYTLINKPNVGICPLILDIMSHPEYDKRFGYRTT